MLRAGPLEMRLDGIDLRYIRLGDREVVRQIYVALRNLAWDTVPANVRDLSVNAGPSSFEVTFEADHSDGDVDFTWKGRITGGPDGAIEYVMDGVVNSGFTRNRIGICLLHPEKECAGVECSVEHVDGSIEQTRFPGAISPHQAFRDLRTITHRVTGDVSVRITFAGEVFETEDQRNWTDDSFKTYGTPMNLPRPVKIEAGTRLHQSVKIELTGVPRKPVGRRAEDAIHVFPVPGAAQPPAPTVGTGAPVSPGMAAPAGDAAIRQLGPSHIRVDVFPLASDWRERLRAAASLALNAGADLDLALYLSADVEPDIRSIAETVGETDSRVAGVTLFAAGAHETPDAVTQTALPLMRRAFPGASIGVGSAADFCQLNRGRPSAHGTDFVAYSINPQVHAFDDRSVIDTLSAQSTTVRSAKALYPGAAVHVGPVTLLPRFNANVPPETDGFGPAPADPRQSALFTAAWTAGSYKYLAEAGAQSLTYFEAVGPAGLKDAGTEAVYPVYHLIRLVAGLPGCSLTPMDSTQARSVNALRATGPGRDVTVVFSLVSEPTRVSVEGLPGAVGVKMLDETTAHVVRADSEEFWQTGDGKATYEGRLELDLGGYATVIIEAMPA